MVYPQEIAIDKLHTKDTGYTITHSTARMCDKMLYPGSPADMYRVVNWNGITIRHWRPVLLIFELFGEGDLQLKIGNVLANHFVNFLLIRHDKTLHQTLLTPTAGKSFHLQTYCTIIPNQSFDLHHHFSLIPVVFGDRKTGFSCQGLNLVNNSMVFNPLLADRPSPLIFFVVFS